ncbi:MAG: hypothetical protein IIA62_09940, partial [Nitrospinae bacterium]|nr:hypothetical protein [Nitrospinota bacterium]
MSWTKCSIKAVLAAVVILFISQPAGATSFIAGETISGVVTDGLTSSGAAGTLTID